MNDNDTVISPNPRAQMETPTFVKPGLEFWWSTKVLIPTDFPQFKGWMTLMSVYGPPFAGSGSWHIASWGKTLEWEEQHRWEMPLVKGQWLNFTWHAKFATNGFAELWVNGVQQKFANGSTRLDPVELINRTNNGGDNNIRISQYRQKGMIPGNATLYFGPIKAATTHAALAAL